MSASRVGVSCRGFNSYISSSIGARNFGFNATPVSRSIARPPCRTFHSTGQRYSNIHSRPKPIQPPPSAWAVSRERAAYVRRMKIYTALILATGAAMVITINSDLFPVQPKSTKSSDATIRFDSPPHPTAPALVETGTSTIPTFPRTIHLPSLDVGDATSSLPAGTSSPSTEEYQLIGLGIRTVSFLSIQVYVVGLYIAVPDISILQERLIRTVDPIATTLVSGERGSLRSLLLDPEKGEEVWNQILKDGKLRTALRIVPTRTTDFAHLRDGWVRAITARTQQAASKAASAGTAPSEFDDEAFGSSINDFKSVFGGARGKLPKAEVLYLLRGNSGGLSAFHIKPLKATPQKKEEQQLFEQSPAPDVEDISSFRKLGEVNDERISRLIWLAYLAGKTVSSESARKSIVDGAMEFVERPVGTVATQVV